MTNAQLAILSLVAEQPRHGYDIEQVIEARDMRAWTEIGFSSIYYLLNKLEKRGLIEGQLQQSEGKGPPRKVYAITQPGQRTLLDSSIEALSNPQRGSSPFLLGLSNYPNVPRAQLLDALNKYEGRIEERLNHLLERADEQRPLPPFVEAMFDYSHVLASTELKWIQHFKEEVEKGNV